LTGETGAMIGAGTVLNIADAKKAVTAGASYIVSPNLDEEIVRFTKKEGLIAIPGACTPTEIYRAYKAGGDIIKLFPFVEIGGLGFLNTIRGPFPFIKYMLCGGATMDNISEYLAADAAGILVGSAIIKRDLVSAEDWTSLTELSRMFVQKIDGILSGNKQ
jgi:2-dehydro-3-deoxyphosphogluconate aldolase/(4S)-4-hydroxy-2-oxoglutarate aldolase